MLLTSQLTLVRPLSNCLEMDDNLSGFVEKCSFQTCRDELVICGDCEILNQNSNALQVYFIRVLLILSLLNVNK